MLLEITFSFLSPDFHELWHSVMSICLITEVKRQWAEVSPGMGDRLSALLVSLMALGLALVDRNPFWPCFLPVSQPQCRVINVHIKALTPL